MTEVYYKIDSREERLPKWAQDHINQLRSGIRTMQRALEQDTSDANTFLECQHPIEPEALGKDSRIIFKVDDSESSWLDTFRVHIEKGTLKIYAAGTVTIRPTSSNCLDIRMER